MKSIAIGLAAAILAAALSPVAAFAADKPAKPTAAEAASAKNHDLGAAEAPPLAKQLGLPCTITDSNYIGQGKGKDAAGKETMRKFYEVACQEGLGYVIQVAEGGGAPEGFDCLLMTTYKPKTGEADKGQIYCRMAANADPVKGFLPVLAKGGVTTCAPNQARWVGSTPDGKFSQYEVGCAEGPAYLISYPWTGSDHKFSVDNCMFAEPGTCHYLPKDKMAAQLAAMAAPANRPCQVTDGRFIGKAASSGNAFYEVACSDQKSGFVLQVDAAGKFVGAIDCGKALNLNGGCTLTSAVAAQTEESATYTRLAKSIGYDCDVKDYHTYGLETASGRELVELACKDHADGAFAMMPVDKGQKGEYFNCVRADIRKLKCALTTPDAIYPKLTAQIASLGKTCQVTNARGVGQSKTDGADFVEVTCAGGPGMILQYAVGAETVRVVTPCAAAASVIGDSCKLK